MNQKKGIYEYFKDKDNTSCTLADYVRPFVDQGQEVTISGNGASMLPTIDETCQLVMMPVKNDAVKPGDVLLYERRNGHSVIHRVWSKHGDKLCMIGDNQIMIEKNVPFEAVVAKVKTIKRSDGSTNAAHQSVFKMRLRYVKKWVRFGYGYARHIAAVIVKKLLGIKS